MTLKSKITPDTSTSFCNHPTYLIKRTILNVLIYNIDVFGMRNISKFTQNSLVLIPYLLNYSQQFWDKFE